MAINPKLNLSRLGKNFEFDPTLIAYENAIQQPLTQPSEDDLYNIISEKIRQQNLQDFMGTGAQSQQVKGLEDVYSAFAKPSGSGVLGNIASGIGALEKYMYSPQASNIMSLLAGSPEEKMLWGDRARQQAQQQQAQEAEMAQLKENERQETQKQRYESFKNIMPNIKDISGETLTPEKLLNISEVFTKTGEMPKNLSLVKTGKDAFQIMPKSEVNDMLIKNGYNPDEYYIQGLDQQGNPQIRAKDAKSLTEKILEKRLLEQATMDLGSEAQKKNSLTMSGLSSITNIANKIDDKTLQELKAAYKTNGLSIQFASPKAKELFSEMKIATQNLGYAKSGAAVGEKEMDVMEQSYAPAVNDTKEDFLTKLNLMQREFQNQQLGTQKIISKTQKILKSQTPTQSKQSKTNANPLGLKGF